MGYIKKLYQNCLVGVPGSEGATEIYPVTSTLAVYDQTGQNNLDTQISNINNRLDTVEKLIPTATSVTVSGVTTIPRFFKLSDIVRVNGIIVSIYNEDEDSNKTSVYLITASRDVEVDEYDVNIVRLGGSGTYPSDSLGFFKAKISSTPQTHILGITYTSSLERDRILVNTLSCNTIEPYTYSSSTPPTEITAISPIDHMPKSGGTFTGDVIINTDLSVLGNITVGDELGGAPGQIHNVEDPHYNNDVANKQYVDSHHDSTKQDTLTFDDAPTAESDNPVKSSGIKTYVDRSQYPVAIVRDALTNINGRTFQHYEATLSTITIDNVQYTIYTITSDGNQLTESSARTYMKYMCGTEFLPVYNYDVPKNPFFVFADQSIWKPQYDSTYGLRLFKVGDSLATKQYVDDHIGVYWATYRTTTNAQIRAAFNAGKIIACKRVMDGQIYYLTALSDGEQDTRFVCVDSRDPRYIFWLGIDSLTGEWYQGYAQYQQYALVTSLSSASDNSHYPSAKAVYDLVKAVVELNRLDMPS